MPAVISHFIETALKMKINYLLSLTILFAGCNSKPKNISFQRSSTENPDAAFLNINTNSIEGQVKAVELSDHVYLSYKFNHKYDTSSNSKMNALLFLGEPLNYSHCSDNYDTVYKQVYDETKFKVDSLRAIIDKQPKRKLPKRPNGKVYDSDHMAMMATKEESELMFMYPSIRDTSALRDYANTIIERRNIARQQKTFPIFYYNPHFKSKTPSFNAVYQIKFLDQNNFEIISFATGKFLMKPFSNNPVEGKIQVEYKDLAKFRKDIFDKAKKILVTILSADQNGL